MRRDQTVRRDAAWRHPMPPRPPRKRPLQSRAFDEAGNMQPTREQFVALREGLL
jgi:hypothetical protein